MNLASGPGHHPNPTSKGKCWQALRRPHNAELPTSFTFMVAFKALEMPSTTLWSFWPCHTVWWRTWWRPKMAGAQCARLQPLVNGESRYTVSRWTAVLLVSQFIANTNPPGTKYWRSMGAIRPSSRSRSSTNFGLMYGSMTPAGYHNFYLYAVSSFANIMACRVFRSVALNTRWTRTIPWLVSESNRHRHGSC